MRDERRQPSGNPVRREIIVTHELTDFDAFAAAVAAQKLYPDATIVLGRRLSPSLRGFLALHKDRFATTRFTDIDQESITRLIAVDVRKKSRLKHFDVLLERIENGDASLDVHVYDHHTTSRDDNLRGSLEVLEPVGSATTLLVERIREAGLSVDVVDATLFTLGIYADTGSLSHPFTTGRDARAVAWLLEHGANLKTLNRYLRPNLNHQQRDLFVRVLENIDTEVVGGVDIGFVTIRLPKAISGLGEITGAAAQVDSRPVLVAIYDIAGRQVQVVARARSRAIDVAKMLDVVGGGGHPSAAAATVKNTSAAEVRHLLLEVLRANAPIPRRVSEVMTNGVPVISREMTLDELRDKLHDTPYDELPVVQNERLVGMITRTDVEKAARDGRLHLPVSSCMSHKIVAVTEDDLLIEAITQMEREHVAALPVVEDGKPIAMLTRQALRRVLYGPVSIRATPRTAAD